MASIRASEAEEIVESRRQLLSVAVKGRVGLAERALDASLVRGRRDIQHAAQDSLEIDDVENLVHVLKIDVVDQHLGAVDFGDGQRRRVARRDALNGNLVKRLEDRCRLCLRLVCNRVDATSQDCCDVLAAVQRENSGNLETTLSGQRRRENGIPNNLNRNRLLQCLRDAVLGLEQIDVQKVVNEALFDAAKVVLEDADQLVRGEGALFTHQGVDHNVKHAIGGGALGLQKSAGRNGLVALVEKHGLLDRTRRDADGAHGLGKHLLHRRVELKNLFDREENLGKHVWRVHAVALLRRSDSRLLAEKLFDRVRHIREGVGRLVEGALHANIGDNDLGNAQARTIIGNLLQHAQEIKLKFDTAAHELCKARLGLGHRLVKENLDERALLEAKTRLKPVEDICLAGKNTVAQLKVGAENELLVLDVKNLVHCAGGWLARIVHKGDFGKRLLQVADCAWAAGGIAHAFTNEHNGRGSTADQRAVAAQERLGHGQAASRGGAWSQKRVEVNNHGGMALQCTVNARLDLRDNSAQAVVDERRLLGQRTWQGRGRWGWSCRQRRHSSRRRSCGGAALSSWRCCRCFRRGRRRWCCRCRCCCWCWCWGRRWHRVGWGRGAGEVGCRHCRIRTGHLGSWRGRGRRGCWGVIGVACVGIAHS
eukprot:m.288286 g.288286  ORF g.288286 m.288286 type:complete len:652 (+) comp11940_c0_seq1:178-2133(+)